MYSSNEYTWVYMCIDICAFLHIHLHIYVYTYAYMYIHPFGLHPLWAYSYVLQDSCNLRHLTCPIGATVNIMDSGGIVIKDLHRVLYREYILGPIKFLVGHPRPVAEMLTAARMNYGQQA